MPRRARIASVGAAAGVVLLAITWYASHYVGFVERADGSILRGFLELDRGRFHGLTNFIASLCDPKRFLFLAAIPVIVAVVRRRPRVAGMLVVILLGANETTQLLKPLLVAPHAYYYGVSAGSWPSGHATAAMSLALSAVIAAPARRRPAVAAAMAAFEIAVSYSFLVLGWHYPSDVLGGFLVAATWTLLAVAGLSIYEARRSGDAGVQRPRTTPISVADALRPVAAMLAVAALFAAVIVLVRPHEVIAYARDHELFVIGACVIGALGLALASGLALVLGRG